MDSWTHKTEWVSRRVTTLGKDAGNMLGQHFDGTTPGWACGVMNGHTALAILLVVQPKRDGMGLC
jgi:hypothetical protein